MSLPEMHPCPFCGARRGDPCFSLGSNVESSHVVAAGCWQCSATGPEAPTIAEAVERWNGRATRWIPVDEAMPRCHMENSGDQLESDKVIVYTRRHSIHLAIYEPDSGDGDPGWSTPNYSRFWTTSEVTHWQPLPPPPTR